MPEPDRVGAYITAALAGKDEGHMLPWAVRELASGAVVGSTRYHDVLAAIDRVEINYTWYAARWQRTHVNTACKLLLFEHAFEGLGCQVVGLRTDNFQPRISKGDRGPGCKEGWCDTSSASAARRHSPRHRHVQCAGERMAGHQGTSQTTAGPAYGFAPMTNHYTPAGRSSGRNQRRRGWVCRKM